MNAPFAQPFLENLLFCRASRPVNCNCLAPVPRASYSAQGDCCFLNVLEGEAELQLGEEKVSVLPGSSVSMPPLLHHGISAKTALRLLLVQSKSYYETLVKLEPLWLS